MTREEIHAKVNVEGSISKANVIDFMWEHFKSRTCENCKFKEVVFNKKDQRNTEVCKNYKSLMYKQYHSDGVMNTFGCSAFERKDK